LVLRACVGYAGEVIGGCAPPGIAARERRDSTTGDRKRSRGTSSRRFRFDMSMHWFTFRQGDRSEYLALYMLSALGLAVPVPRQEDVGIDFHCNLARQDGEAITYFAPYNVQVKSASVKRLEYGGHSKKKKKDKPPEWKGYEIQWILSQETPYFIAIVDKDKAKLRLFSTATRWFAVHNPKPPYELVFRPYVPTGDGHLGNGTKTPLEVSVPEGVDALRRRQEIT
jgi:hypothetical protein